MSGGFNPTSLITQVAIGAMTGGSSLLLQAALRTVVSAIGQQVIQQVGQQLGFPQSVIDLAQGAFAGSVGDTAGATQNYQEAIASVGQQFGASPAEIGNANRTADAFTENLTQMVLEGARQARENGDETAQAARGARGVGGSGGGSLLMKIAVALGSLMDEKMTEMAGITDEIGNLGGGPDNQSKLGELTGRLQGLSQETNMLSNALTNSIKTIGESATTLARKG